MPWLFALRVGKLPFKAPVQILNKKTKKIKGIFL